MSRIRSRGRITLALVPAVLILLVLTSCTAGSPPAADPTSAASDGTAAQPTPTDPGTEVPDSTGHITPVVAKIHNMMRGSGPAGSMLYTGTAGVALTFDDGPDPTYTPIILDMLKANDIKATFCVVGKRAKLYPDLLRRIVAEGHTMCNHSMFHDMGLGKMTEGQIRSDLQQTIDAIHAAVPNAPVRYFRAPGGNFTPLLVRVAGSMGMRSLYWAVDPRDWDFNQFGKGQSMVNHIVGVVEGQTRPGSIILSHDLSKPDTMAAYRVLMPWLKARFQLVAMPL